MFVIPAKRDELMLKKLLKTFFRSVGFDIVKWAPGYHCVLYPIAGVELSPLELVVPQLAAAGDFYFVQIGANNGVRNDPLRSLILKYHLRGLLVEPLTDMFDELKKTTPPKRNSHSRTRRSHTRMANCRYFDFPRMPSFPITRTELRLSSKRFCRKKGESSECMILKKYLSRA